MADSPIDFDYPRVLLVALAAVTLVALLVAASTSTAAFGTYNPAWDGASDLREVARETGADATVAHDLGAYEEAAPNETVAVILAPEEPYTDDETARLRTFLENGGTLVVADDFGSTGNALLTDLGANSSINGTLLRDERYFYRSPSLPIATNVTSHRFTRGVDSLTINHASAVGPNGATVLVTTSEFAYADENRNGELDGDEDLGSYPTITTESVANGTLVVAGDPSLFINVMLERPGNAAFVQNLFGGHAFVLLDYSHAGGLPPIPLAVLVLRWSIGLQLLLGLGGLGAIGLWVRGRLPHPAPRPTIEPTPPLSEAELLAYIDRQHPDWDDERAKRVVRGLKTDRTQSRRDE